MLGNFVYSYAVALRLAGELEKQVTLYECPDGAWRVGQ